MLLSTILLLPLAVNALPASFSSILVRQTPALEEATDRLLFSSSMSQFQSARNARNPSGLDWSSNGCTASPDNPLGFNFLQSCQRHDFGYRNYKAQNRFSDAGKGTIDDLFREDMYNQCAPENAAKEALCRGVANLYYEAVKAFGSKKRGVEMEIAGLEIAE